MRNNKIICITSSYLGSGGYADDKIAAVSTTGHGEAIMKVCLAHHVTMNVQQGTANLFACYFFFIFRLF